MKELSVEEKAKRYDEAIEIAKSKIKNDKDHVLYEDDIISTFGNNPVDACAAMIEKLHELNLL
jgi:hypothetical protein